MIRFLRLILSLLLSAYTLSGFCASLVGTWKLAGFEATSTSAKSLSCPSPTALLTYTASGYVAVGFNCMQANNSKQPNFTLDKMTFYTGKYSVKDNVVTHFIHNASSPEYYNKKLSRHIDLLTDNQLILSLNQNGNHIIAKWVRVG